MNFKKTILAAFTGLVLFSSCEKNDDKIIVPLGAFDNGILVLNQGVFGKDNSSVSFISNDYSTLQNDIFSIANPSLTLGDTAQDIGFYNDLAFIVVNVSNKIEIVNRYTFKHIASIKSGLNNPRYISFCNGKGYVTNWGDGNVNTDDFVAIINLENNTISSTISVIEGPEKMIVKDKNIYVAHLGGFGFGNSISIINANNNTVSQNINVGDLPNSLRIESNNLYVLCEGKPNYSGSETAGKLVKVNLTDNSIASNLDFTDLKHPKNLNIYNNQMFYNIGNQIYKTDLSNPALTIIPLLSINSGATTNLYNFEVENNSIFAADATDFNSDGKIYIYSLIGELQKSFTVGNVPCGFYW